MLEFGTAWLVWMTEVPLYYLLMSGVAQKKCPAWLNLAIGFGLATIMTVGNILNHNNGIINITTTFLAVILYGKLCYTISVPRAAFFSGVINLILLIGEFTAMGFAASLLGMNANAYQYSKTFLLIGGVFGRSIQVLCAVLIRGVFQRFANRPRLPFHFILFPFVTVIGIAMMQYISVTEALSPQATSILVDASILMLITAVFGILSQFHFQEAEEEYRLLKTESVRHQTERDYYSILEEQNNALMIYAHDAKKHLAAIRSLSTDPKTLGYVDRLSDQLHSVTRSGHSGNRLLDVILEKYVISCRHHGIRFDYDVKLCNLPQLEDIDLVAILGNLMDNAVEAAAQSSEKTIQLSTAKRNSYSVLIITNSCDKAPSFTGGSLLSTKADPVSHGYGIRSVKRTLQKYSGDLDWEYDEAAHQFTATAMIGSS